MSDIIHFVSNVDVELMTCERGTHTRAKNQQQQQKKNGFKQLTIFIQDTNLRHRNQVSKNARASFIMIFASRISHHTLQKKLEIYWLHFVGQSFFVPLLSYYIYKLLAVVYECKWNVQDAAQFKQNKTKKIDSRLNWNCAWDVNNEAKVPQWMVCVYCFFIDTIYCTILNFWWLKHQFNVPTIFCTYLHSRFSCCCCLT